MDSVYGAKLPYTAPYTEVEIRRSVYGAVYGVYAVPYMVPYTELKKNSVYGAVYGPPYMEFFTMNPIQSHQKHSGHQKL